MPIMTLHLRNGLADCVKIRCVVGYRPIGVEFSRTETRFCSAGAYEHTSVYIGKGPSDHPQIGYVIPTCGLFHKAFYTKFVVCSL